MKPCFSARTKRHTAFLVLLGWLFAMVSGFANACLLEARVTHIHTAAVGASETAKAPLVSPAHAGVVAGHHDDSHAAEAPCLKACNDSAHSLPKKDARAIQADPGLVPLMSISWAATTPAVPASLRRDDVQPALPGQPIRVRYSRLAL